MWYSKTAEETVQELRTDPATGLSSREAARRLQEWGPNRLADKKKTPLVFLFLAQINDMLIYILLAAALVSALLGEVSDAIIILLVVVVNAAVGVIQESKAEKALEALKKLASPRAVVKRDGKPVEIEAAGVVPGDIVLIDAGRIIPCDLRWIESVNLKVEEASLTGESVPVEKDCDLVITNRKSALGDRRNMGYLSTQATYGRGVGIADRNRHAYGNRERSPECSARRRAEPTPLQKKLELSSGSGSGTGILILCGIDVPRSKSAMAYYPPRAFSLRA